MKNKLSVPFFIALLSVILLNTYIVIKIYNQRQIAENTFRLHIVANSNSISDKIVKLKINEKINKYIKEITKNCKSKKMLENTLSENIENILNITNLELKKQNVEYIASANLGNISYDKKENINYSMPKGSYDSLQIVLGKGEGENIWSLLFPDQDSVENLEGFENILPGISNLYDSQETEDKNIYTFKILEIINSVKEKL